MNKEVTHSNLKGNIFDSLKGPNYVNRNVSHSKTPSAKDVQNNNTRVSMCIVDANQSRLLRQLSPRFKKIHQTQQEKQPFSNQVSVMTI